MTAKLALRLLVLMIGLALCVGGLYFLLRPTEYKATVQIKIEPDLISDGSGYITYDPYFMETEFKAMGSKEVLGNVIETLNLNGEWGKRYGGGGTLETDETIKLLRQRMELAPVQNSKLVDISVWDENPDEAARIANAIADAYRKYHLEQHREQMAGGIRVLEKQYQEDEVQIQLMQSNVDQLRKELNINDTNPPDDFVD